MTEQPPSSGTERFVDVDLLVDDLRERVERERAAGHYDDDVTTFQLEPVDGDRAHAGDSEAPASPVVPQVVYRPEVGYSSRPVIGPVLTGVKRLFYRLFHYPLDDLAKQTNAAVHQLHVRGDRAEQAVETVQALRERIDTLANQLELAHRLTARELGARRPEPCRAPRRARSDAGATSAAGSTRPPRAPGPSTAAVGAASTYGAAGRCLGPTRPDPPSFDYMTFENRFRPEKTRPRAAQRVPGDPRGRRRALSTSAAAEASCSSCSATRESRRTAWTSTQTTSPSAGRKGSRSSQGDAVGALEGARGGVRVDGIVASHLIEHLTPDLLWRLITAAAEALDGGRSPHPRDAEPRVAPRRLDQLPPRPDARAAGPSRHARRSSARARLSRRRDPAIGARPCGGAPARGRRPTKARCPSTSATVVEQLNELIYGYQDYALIARL